MTAATPETPVSSSPPEPPQRIIKVRRDYNRWVASETMEDYALRYTPQRFRQWSEWRVANTALGVASFLILEAVGATLLVRYGFVNAFWAILCTGLIIFLAGWPISVYAARYGVDMDLLTRGAGFGYIGSTITSLVYASFTFIFFALEAAVMAYALELALGLPPAWGYFVCALVVVPLVTHGVSVISRFQVWTQPLWLVMMCVPYVAVWWQKPDAFVGIAHYKGELASQPGFDLHLFGAAMTVGVALITQMGEQADYLRFMPAPQAQRRWRWWWGVLAGGPGWVVPGVLKMLGGVLLAYLAMAHMVPAERAVDPNQMYLVAYEYVFNDYGWAVAATAVFVVVSQLKINVTNAYAGSLAWSNFFSRLTHSHPGRVVWVVFNTSIAFMLMEMNVFQALGHVLGLYANIAIAWIMAVVADLVINKPLGWSPPGIEFKRAYLYDINPVGVGAMGLASALGIAAHLGLMGSTAQAFSALVAMVTALVVSPAIAWWTRGRYYLARSVDPVVFKPRPADTTPPAQHTCVVCGGVYESPDTAHCPAYQGPICSLCCTLDARCGDLCKPHARLSEQWAGALRRATPQRMWPYLGAGLAHYLLLMLGIAVLLLVVLATTVRGDWGRVYGALLLVSAVLAWWLVLAHKSREVAQEESNRQTRLLMQEIASHKRTDEQLQQAKQVADKARHVADQANQAKTRYISTISHELRTPLNSILGYAQLLQSDGGLSPQRTHAIQVILRGGEHLLSLIEGTLDIAHIESGRLALESQVLDLRRTVAEVAGMFELQATAKGLRFVFDEPAQWPRAVRVDGKRLRQILLNLLGNAVKFTALGEVCLRVRYARDMAVFEVQDTGPGVAPAELDRIFEPFARGGSQGVVTQGSGLGLTIARMLTDVMGGELTASSEVGRGSVFKVRLFLPELQVEPTDVPAGRLVLDPTGFEGPAHQVLVVDNEEADRVLLARWLEPLGFRVAVATNGEEALQWLRGGLRPAVVFMDLAMPGMDGWEALRQIQAMSLDPAPVLAVVSANAFDKGLDNAVGLPASDFLVKPVRREDLLAWVGERLNLTWVLRPPEPQATPVPLADAAPCFTPADVQALSDLARLGYYRGFVQRLDAMGPLEPPADGVVRQWRGWARAFRFEAITQQLQEVADAHQRDGQ